MKEKAEKKAIEFRRPKRGKLRKINCKPSLFIMNMRTVPNEFLKLRGKLRTVNWLHELTLFGKKIACAYAISHGGI